MGDAHEHRGGGSVVVKFFSNSEFLLGAWLTGRRSSPPRSRKDRTAGSLWWRTLLRAWARPRRGPGSICSHAGERCAPVSVIYSARWMKTRFQGAELETALLYEEEGGGAEPEGGSSQASSSEDSLIAHWRTSRFSGA